MPWDPEKGPEGDLSHIRKPPNTHGIRGTQRPISTRTRIYEFTCTGTTRHQAQGDKLALSGMDHRWGTARLSNQITVFKLSQSPEPALAC